MNFNGKHIVITGAASGLGRLFALRFLELGASVAAWDIDREGLERLAREVDGCTPADHEARLKCFVCDVASSLSIEKATERTLSDLGSVDIVLNNAGVVSGNWIVDLSDDSLSRTFSVNALGPIRVTKAFLPSMIARRSGHIVSIASAGGYLGTPRLSDYCASKAAVVSFDESLRMELKRKNLPISTTVISPFFVDTGMFEGVRSRFSLLLPVLRPERVVERGLRAIYRRQARLIMPRFVYVTFICRVLPVRWFDGLARFFGISRAMDNFVGRS